MHAAGYPPNYPPSITPFEISDHSVILKWSDNRKTKEEASLSLSRTKKNTNTIDFTIKEDGSIVLPPIETNKKATSQTSVTTRRQGIIARSNASDFLSIYQLSYVYLGPGNAIVNLNSAVKFNVAEEEPKEEQHSFLITPNETEMAAITAPSPNVVIHLYTGPSTSFKVEELLDNSRYRFILKARKAQPQELKSTIPEVDPTIVEWCPNERILQVTTEHIRAKDRHLDHLVSGIMMKDNIDVMELLNSKGYMLKDYINCRNKEGKTLLMLACKNFIKAPEVIHKLCVLGADVDATTMVGKTALMVSASQGSAKGVEVLLMNNASLDLTDKTGSTALMWGCESGNLEAVICLVSKGANIYIKDIHSNHALHRIASIANLNAQTSEKFREIAKVLILKSLGQPIKPQKEIEKRRSVDVESLITSPVLPTKQNEESMLNYIEAKNESGMTPLLLAAMNGNLPLIELLIEYKADHTVKSASGNGAITLAKNNRQFAIVKFLEKFKTAQ